MLQRAVACFHAQTHLQKILVIVDSGLKPAPITPHMSVYVIRKQHGYTLGALRNWANHFPHAFQPEVIAHFDDDDFSHPARIAEQVALLQASGKEAVGYREMLFWRREVMSGDPTIWDGEAWLYSNGNPRYALGTSLCYWRSVWERRPFEDKQHGEDTAWLLGVDSLGVNGTAYQLGFCWENGKFRNVANVPDSPRMIASIHGGNTSPAYRAELMQASEKQGGEWKRAPQWDDYCRRTMEGGCLSKSSSES